MHIINAFFSLTHVTSLRFRSLFRDSDGQYDEIPSNDEEHPGLHASSSRDHSLTREYEDFSHSWSALRLCLYHAIVYYAIAVFALSFILYKWPIIDSLYFATVVFTTIGYGDLHPTDRSGRVFTIFLSLYGIVILGLFLGILGDAVVEGHNRVVETRRRKLNKKVLDALAQDQGAKKNVAESNGDNGSSSSDDVVEVKSLMQDIWSIVVLEAPIVSLVVLLAFLVGYVEKWPLIDSLYWVVISGTTVGFGDVTPHTPAMRVAAIFFLPFAVAVLGELLARVASAYMERKQRQTEHEFLSRSLTLCDLETMDADQDGRVDRAEFMIYMLVALQKVEKADVDQVCQFFERLDQTNDGYLTKQDLLDRQWSENFRSSLAG